MSPIKFPTKHIFWNFYLLKINRMVSFCNLFTERPSYILPMSNRPVVLVAEGTASDVGPDDRQSKQRTESKPSQLSALSKEQSVEFFAIFAGILNMVISITKFLD